MSCKVKSHLICLFGRASNAAGTAASGLVAALDHAFEVEKVQQNAADQRIKAAEGVPPMIFPGNEPKQQIGQQSRPDLPSDGVFIVAHEVCQLKRATIACIIRISSCFYAIQCRVPAGAERADRGTPHCRTKRRIPSVRHLQNRSRRDIVIRCSDRIKYRRNDMRIFTLRKICLLVIVLMTSAISYAQPGKTVPLAIFDFDGTIIDGDCCLGLIRDGQKIYDGMIAAWIISGACEKYKGEEDAKRFLDRCVEKERSGHMREACLDETIIFAGADANDFQAFCRKRFETLKKYCFVESVRKIHELQAAGVEVHVISASAESVVRAAAGSLGIPEENIHGVRLAIKDGKLTNEIIEPVTYREGKILAMRQIEKERNGKALYGFGNSYVSDGPFLLEIVKQGGKSVMINGGMSCSGMSEHFQCITLTETFASRQKDADKK